MINDYYPFINKPLPYAYDALEPFIDAKTLEVHHSKLLQNYVNNLNNLLRDKPYLQQLSLEELIQNSSLIPGNLAVQIRNNAGGVYNHRLYFDSLSENILIPPSDALKAEIEIYFGDYINFLSKLRDAALSVFGSGYVWLVYDEGKLRIVTTPNQNCPVEQYMYPLLNIDVWEHSYFIKYYNDRKSYIDALLNIINWSVVSERYSYIKNLTLV